MAVCGYNKKIGTGLHQLFDGMIDSMEEKAIKANDEIKVLDIELRELSIMIEKMQIQCKIYKIDVHFHNFWRK